MTETKGPTMRPAAPTCGSQEYSTALTCSGPSINYQGATRRCLSSTMCTGTSITRSPKSLGALSEPPNLSCTRLASKYASFFGALSTCGQATFQGFPRDDALQPSLR